MIHQYESVPQAYDQGQTNYGQPVQQQGQPIPHQVHTAYQQGQPVYQQGISAQQMFVGGNNNIVGPNQYIPQFQMHNNGLIGPVFVTADPLQLIMQQQDVMEKFYVSRVRWFSICNSCVGLIAIILFSSAVINRSYWYQQSINPTIKGGDEGSYVGVQSDYDQLIQGFDIFSSGYFIWFFASCLSLVGFYRQFRQVLLVAYQLLLILSLILLIIGGNMLFTSRMLGFTVLGYLIEIIYSVVALIVLLIRSFFLHFSISQIKQQQIKLNYQTQQQNQFQQPQGNQIY